jgi:hypothetical protein
MIYEINIGIQKDVGMELYTNILYINAITIKTRERDGDGDATTVYVPAHFLRILKQFIYLKEGIINMDP